VTEQIQIHSFVDCFRTTGGHYREKKCKFILLLFVFAPPEGIAEGKNANQFFCGLFSHLPRASQGGTSKKVEKDDSCSVRSALAGSIAKGRCVEGIRVIPGVVFLNWIFRKIPIAHPELVEG